MLSEYSEGRIYLTGKINQIRTLLILKYFVILAFFTKSLFQMALFPYLKVDITFSEISVTLM